MKYFPNLAPNHELNRLNWRFRGNTWPPCPSCGNTEGFEEGWHYNAYENSDERYLTCRVCLAKTDEEELRRLHPPSSLKTTP